MGRPLDLSKFRKTITKSIEGLSIGFNDPKTWVSTGSYALNYLVSGSFYKGLPLSKVSILAGESGAGKSLLSANVIRNAQQMGIYVIVIDTENALDESWLKAFDIDTSEDKLLKLSMAMVDDVAKTISEFVKSYKEIPEDERPEVMFVIDSLGMLLTPVAVNQFEKGELKGDMGHKPKALKALVTNCVNMFGSLGIGMLCTNHTYASQDMFNPDPKVSGGDGPVYAASMLIAMRKGKLKEDEDGNKTSDVSGIRAMCKVMKTRYSKPFEGCELKIPYDGGLDIYSGLLEMFEENGLLAKDGNRLNYVAHDGRMFKLFRKEWNSNVDGCLDTVMQDIMNTPGGLFKTVEPEDEPVEEISSTETVNTPNEQE
jgi:RecA/RadA recombinase